jgi:hypothetical protein
MKIKYIIALLVFISFTSFAQELLTNVTWNIGIPVSKMNQYTTDVTYRGFTIAGRRFLDKYNSVGFMTGWNVFDEKSYDPIDLAGGENGSGTLSGTQIRSVNSFPLLVGIHHHYGKKEDMRVFLGLNAGMYYILQRLDVGVYRLDNDNWHFGMAPEAGIIIPFDGENTGFYLGARYNYAFDSGTTLGGSENNFYSFYEINIGFAFSSRWF